MEKVKQIVKPIKDKNVLSEVKDTLLNSFKYGRRNYTVFQVGKATMLRVSDVLSLRYDDVYTSDGEIKLLASVRDKKTGKSNTLHLNPVQTDLARYHAWLKDNNVQSEWLFPSIKRQKDEDKHIDERQYYRIISKVGKLLGIDYLGTHTMRKTGAYMVYEQSGNNIGLVMKLLNHTSQGMTLAYLGLDDETIEKQLNAVNFD